MEMDQTPAKPHPNSSSLLWTCSYNWHHFEGNAATTDEILFEMNNLSSPDGNQLVFLTSFGLKDFHSGPSKLDKETIEFKYQTTR